MGVINNTINTTTTEHKEKEKHYFKDYENKLVANSQSCQANSTRIIASRLIKNNHQEQEQPF